MPDLWKQVYPKKRKRHITRNYFSNNNLLLNRRLHLFKQEFRIRSVLFLSLATYCTLAKTNDPCWRRVKCHGYLKFCISLTETFSLQRLISWVWLWISICIHSCILLRSVGSSLYKERSCPRMVRSIEKRCCILHLIPRKSQTDDRGKHERNLDGKFVFVWGAVRLSPGEWRDLLPPWCKPAERRQRVTS